MTSIRLHLLLVHACFLALGAVCDSAQASGLQIRSISKGEQVILQADGTRTKAPEIMAGEQAAVGRPRTSGPMCAWPMACATPRAAPAYRLNLLDYAQEIAAASAAWGVSPALVRAVIHAESAFDPGAVSSAGAQGLMQLMPGTAARFGVSDPFDPVQNIAGGVQYLSWLLVRFGGDLTLATAAYNAGEGAVDRYGGVPPFKETRNYVLKVAQLVDAYDAAAGEQVAALPAAAAAKDKDSG